MTAAFNIGDRVRLTGKNWDDLNGTTSVGDVVSVEGYEAPDGYFSDYPWFTGRDDERYYIYALEHEDYSAELVEPAVRSGYQETPDGRLTKNGISQREAHIRTIEDLQRVIRSRNETIDSLQAKATEQAGELESVYEADAFPFKPLADLQRRIGQANAEKGFHEEGEWIRSLAAEQEIDEALLRNYAVARLALITTEVAEAIEEVRHGHAVDETYYNTPIGRAEIDGKPEGVPSELADIVIRALDFADEFGIDLPAMIHEKLAYNATRPFKHGKEM